jgi:hypothetical protein
MPDAVQDFVSQQNLFNLAQGQQPQPTQPQPNPSVSEDSSGMDAYMPPVPSTNVVHLPQFYQRKYISYDVEPQAARENDSFNSMAKTLEQVIKEKESTDNYQAVNPKSSASGAYQYTDSTWNNYGGYPKAALAPPAVQDQKFREDIQHRLAAFDGDPYKAIAAHYLPALADDPTKWNKPFKVHGRVVKPVLSYVRYVTKGTPLEAGLDEYLANRQ